MPQTRKLVRDGVRAVLSDVSTGFNARLAAIAGEYGIRPFEIDWRDDSRTFIQANLAMEQQEVCNLLEFPGCTLYTTALRPASPGQRTIGPAFDGTIIANIDFYLRYRPMKLHAPDADGAAGANDLESMREAVEDAVMQVLDAADWGGPAKYTEMSSDADPVILTGDGWETRIAIQAAFDVRA